MVPKNKDDWCPWGGYRSTNNATAPDHYSIPHIHDFSNSLWGKIIFSKLGLARAFYHIPVEPKDSPKTVITTPIDPYEFFRMHFGLWNAAQIFQRFMDQVICGLNYVFVYIDDVPIASTNEREHREHLRIVF